MSGTTPLGWIDTHAHLYLESMHEDSSGWKQRLIFENIDKVLLPNIDLDSIDTLHQLCAEDPSRFHPMMGLHPCDVKDDYIKVLEQIKKQLYDSPEAYCGVGEIGLDYHWDLSFVEDQKQALKTQFEWAIELNKAVSIHSRKSNHDVIPLITKYAQRGLKGVMHCFSGSIEEANRIIDCGFLLGIGGVLTYPKAGLAEVIKKIDLKHIVLETDSPFLPPVPLRGKKNESSYIPIIGQCLAELKGISIDVVRKITSENAMQIFSLQKI